MRRLRTSICLALLSYTLAVNPAPALEMFGLMLEQSNATDLRRAVKQAGAVPVREGSNNAFDLYRSQDLLPGSLALFLGFTDNGGQFAFLEYSLQPRLLQDWVDRLSAKYGEPQIQPGRFLTDAGYRWNQGPVQVRLYKDFRHRVLRLQYSIPERLQQLRGAAVDPAPANPDFY